MVPVDNKASEMALSGEYTPEEIAKWNAQEPAPKYPINMGDEKEPKLQPKLLMEDESNSSGQLYIEPSDLNGLYDFSIDVQSMQVSADEERKQARQQAVTMLTTNPNVIAMLAQDQVKPKFKELFVIWLEDLGFTDAGRFFEKMNQQPAQGAGDLEGALAAMGGGGGEAPQTGIPGGTNPNAGGEASQETPFAIDRNSKQNEGLGPASPKSLEG
jgi:hypothetical protein